MKVKRADLERLVDDAIRPRWMNEDVMTRLRADAIPEREEALGFIDEARSKLQAAVRRKEDQVARVINAIVDTGQNAALVAKLRQLETEANALKVGLEVLESAEDLAPAEITDDVEALIQTTAREIEHVLSHATHPEAPRDREMVRSMIERITVTHHESGAIEICVRGAYAGVMQAAGLVERHALKTITAPEADARRADLSVVAGARNCLDLLLSG